jgi:hypothetical protein
MTSGMDLHVGTAVRLEGVRAKPEFDGRSGIVKKVLSLSGGKGVSHAEVEMVDAFGQIKETLRVRVERLVLLPKKRQRSAGRSDQALIDLEQDSTILIESDDENPLLERSVNRARKSKHWKCTNCTLQNDCGSKLCIACEQGGRQEGEGAAGKVAKQSPAIVDLCDSDDSSEHNKRARLDKDSYSQKFHENFRGRAVRSSSEDEDDDDDEDSSSESKDLLASERRSLDEVPITFACFLYRSLPHHVIMFAWSVSKRDEKRFLSLATFLSPFNAF